MSAIKKFQEATKVLNELTKAAVSAVTMASMWCGVGAWGLNRAGGGVKL